jgi:hypothetical protein
MTTIKFTALSPLTTDLLRKRTRLQQQEKKLVIGRTVAKFFGEASELLQLLDFLVTEEIPFAGANSREVKRFRELRQMLKAATGTVPLARNVAEAEEQKELASHVAILGVEDPSSGLRDQILDLIDQLWEAAVPRQDPAALKLTDMADASNPNVSVDYRRWLAENL